MKLVSSQILLFLVLPISLYSQIQGEDEIYLEGDRVESKFNGGAKPISIEIKYPMVFRNKK